MNVLVVGGTGTIGSAVADALRAAGHTVRTAARSGGDLRVDITSPESIRALFAQAGRVDAIVTAAGGVAWKPLEQLTDEDFETSLHYKLMGQVNVVRYGLNSVADGGSITLTSGARATEPIPGSSAVSLVNAGLEGFARAAALDLPRGIRINAVSPPRISRDPSINHPPEVVARAYVDAVTGSHNGQVLDTRNYA
jgi:NAD(P)-dependent dehydrogenase (short-subunit alcohol dehydrogenase family)